MIGLNIISSNQNLSLQNSKPICTETEMLRFFDMIKTQVESRVNGLFHLIPSIVVKFVELLVWFAMKMSYRMQLKIWK